MCYVHNLRHLAVHGVKGIYPVDGKAAALHTSEPCHLPLGKLVDGYLQLAEHLFVTGLADDILGDKLVFQTIVDKTLGGNAAVERPYPLRGAA